MTFGSHFNFGDCCNGEWGKEKLRHSLFWGPRPEQARRIPDVRSDGVWRGRLACIALVPLLLSGSMSVVPDGYAGVRVSEISGVQPGTLYPGLHLVTPFVEHIATYDLRDHIYATSAYPGKTGETEGGCGNGSEKSGSADGAGT